MRSRRSLLTRRTVLAGLPVGAIASPSAAAETAADRVYRLSRELSEALVEWNGGAFMAEIYPAGHPTTNAFINCRHRATSTREQFDHHLAELKRAAEELDPCIADWTVAVADDYGGCGLSIVAFRRTGRYEGDGLYEGGREMVTGHPIIWRVQLLNHAIDGQRAFDVRNEKDRMVLSERRFVTFIGRKLGGVAL